MTPEGKAEKFKDFMHEWSNKDIPQEAWEEIILASLANLIKTNLIKKSQREAYERCIELASQYQSCEYLVNDLIKEIKLELDKLEGDV